MLITPQLTAAHVEVIAAKLAKELGQDWDATPEDVDHNDGPGWCRKDFRVIVAVVLHSANQVVLDIIAERVTAMNVEPAPADSEGGDHD